MPRVHPEALLHEARRLADAGLKRESIAKRLGVSVSTVERWTRQSGADAEARRAKLDGLARQAALRLPLFGEGRR